MQAKRISIFEDIRQEYAREIKDVHLVDLLKDPARSQSFVSNELGIMLDYTRQRMTDAMLSRLVKMVEELDLFGNIEKMFTGVISLL